MTHILLRFLPAALLFIMFSPFAAHAAVVYSATPLVIDIDVQARDITSRDITLKNTGDQPVTLYPTVNNISLSEGGGIEEFLPPVESDRTASLASWIEVSRLGVDLKPGETRTIPVTFRIHPEPKPGTYHAFIGFGYGRNRDEAEKQVASGQAPGTVVTLTIEEKTNTFLKLSRFIVDRFVTTANNQAAVYTFSNPGDEEVVPQGEIIFYDKRGEEIGMVKVNEERLSIPPGGEHVFKAHVPTDGLFGKYKAFLSVEYGSAQRGTVQDTSFFYVFPTKVLIMLFVLIVAVVGGTSWYVHKKYFDTDTDDTDRITVHIRDTKSTAQAHDLDLSKS